MADSPTHSSSKAGDIPAKTIVLFNKYEVGKLLGCGASGKVYHARNLSSGQGVAIKAVSKQNVAKGGLVAQVKREIAIMRRLRHPNVVKLLEVLATKTKIYFVMEFAKGGELFDRVAKGRFSENLSRRYFQQLITGVGYCHARGVFHRDLKPENLLLDEKLNLKISDFGLSAVRDQVRSDGMLYTLCGTPAYVAPEILAKKGYDGARVDVWSCGVILYVMIAGYLPFNDTNLMNMYRKIYRGEFKFPKWTSPDLRRLLSRLLDKNPATRITVDEIVCDPWFIKDYKHKNLYADDFEFKLREDEQTVYLNAFHLISFSSGFDLSWLLNDSDFSDCGERFPSSETPKKVIETVEAVAGAENIKVRRNKNLGVKLEGLNGNFVMIVEIYRLTQQLVVVEMRGKEKNVNSCRGIWKNKLWPKLGGLIYQPPPPPATTEEHGNCTD